MANQISFQGSSRYLQADPKIGVCSRCRYVVGEIHPITGKVYEVSHMHHEVYDSTDALAHTIELCPYCHNKATWEGRNKRATKLIKIDPEVHRKLTELASWGDTLSDIINMLIDEHNARVKERKGK